MKYQKIVKDNYNLHLINTDKFKTVNVKINFKKEIKKDEITIRNFINDLLINTSKKYKTFRDIEIETQELYNLGISSFPYKSGNYHIVSFHESFLNEKYTEKGMNKKSIEFMLELIFNPNICDDKFDSEMFNIVKNNIKDDLKSIKDNPRRYSLIKLYEAISDGPLSYHSAGYLEDLNKITEKKLCSYYQDLITNNQIDIFIIGNLVDDYTELFDKYIKNKNNILDKKSHFLDVPFSKYKEIKEEAKFKQSHLCMTLSSDKITDFERKYVLSLYSIILGGGTNSKLFTNVREKNSLCYSVSSHSSIITGIVTIEAGINASNYNKAISLIKKEIDKIKAGEITDEEIKQAKEIYISGCKEITDSPVSIINNYLSYEYLSYDLAQDRIKLIKKITKKDIITLANKLKYNKTFMLEGTLENE